MTAPSFVDSNVLIYSVCRRAADQSKAQVAREILSRNDLAFSVQVLQEFYVQAIRPSRPDHVSHEEAIELILTLNEYPVQPMTLALLHAALRTKHRYQISYWDAAVIEAARALGCDTVLSEDLSDTQDYGGVRVVNPFA